MEIETNNNISNQNNVLKSDCNKINLSTILKPYTNDTKLFDNINNINSVIDEDSAINGLKFVKNLCNLYQQVLTKKKVVYEKDKKEVHDVNEKNQMKIKTEEMNAIKNERKNHEEVLSNIQKKKNIVWEEYNKDLNSYLSNNITRGALRKLIEKIIHSFIASSEKDISNSLQQIESTYEQLKVTLDKYYEQENLLYQKKLEKIKAVAERDYAKESIRYKDKLERLKNNFENEVNDIANNFKIALNEIMNDDDVKAYINNILVLSPSFDEYACSNTIPEYICLGNIVMEIARKNYLQPEVLKFIVDEVKTVIEINDSDKLIARLPYCQRFDNGISLFLNYSHNDRKSCQEYLRLLLLKLFMSFPAGKLEATMIDPLELGETFSMFTKLGEEQSRIIDTKIWSQEKDISESIKILRQKLETMTQTYGNDKDMLLKKETIKVLAITDFPTGFTQEALRDLQAIVRKSASYGVSVFIWANNEEIEKLQESQQSIFNEIKHMLHVANVKENDIIELETSKYGSVVLELDKFNLSKEKTDKIINVLAQGIHSSQNKIERFEDMFNNIEDTSNWFSKKSIDELSIPIGIKGANTIVKMVMGKTDGSTAHHVLIAGQTGAGKSTLLHTIIMSTLLSYSPDEVQLYLVDFKEGVEFKTYSKLNLAPIKVVAIDCEREFGHNILKELQKEMKRRYELFKREADREEISDYRKVTGKKIPKILVIFDEIQELFRGSFNDGITKECENLLGELLTLGRAAGIHIVLASQNFNLIPSIKPTLLAHAAIRIAINGSEDSANSVLGESNYGAKQLQDGVAGAAVYNDKSGKESANVIFQVAYLEKNDRTEYLNKLINSTTYKEFEKNNKTKTRVLLTNVEDDIYNSFNQFILNKKVSDLNNNMKECSLIVGDGFEMNRKFEIGISTDYRQNILMIGNDEKKAASLFYFTILSILYNGLMNTCIRKNSKLINIINLSAEESSIETNSINFDYIESLFPEDIEHSNVKTMEHAISNIYNLMIRRIDGEEESNERIFLLFFGIDRAHKLINRNMYEDDIRDMTTLEKFIEILKKGEKYGISCIIWGENLSVSSRILGIDIERYFVQRIAFSTDAETMEKLVMEHACEVLRASSAVFMNIDEDIKNTHFRPYEIPVKDWLKDFADTYHKFKLNNKM